jgi:polysaccharide chain length determinant protein (PEP-CTERM system associated)
VLPGKKYGLDDVIGALWRRRWLLFMPLAVCTVTALAVAKFLPNRYKSETLIMLLPQRIPDSYVKTTVTAKIEDRLATLESQILSRSRLERIILDLDLYRKLRERLPMEDVVQRMRSDIAIKIEGKESFRVSYVSDSPAIAQNTTDRLASLFIEENLRDRENQAEDTNQFLDSQLQDARRRLIEQEKKLEEYRRRYSGQLPSQATTNLQAIQNLQLQLQTLDEATDRARERRLLLERQVADLEAPDPLSPGAMPALSPEGAMETPGQQLDTARARLRLLLTRAKPDHPDVKMLQRTIRDLELRQQAESNESGGAIVPVERPTTPAEGARQKRIRDLKAELQVIDREIQDKQQQEKHLRGEIAEYQIKLDAMPSRESDLVELTRDYTTLQTSYQSLLAKREESKLAANLERRNIGEQFKVLDPARAPERPFSPNRPVITAIGAVAGLLLGAALVLLTEYRDSTLSCEDDVARLFQLPVLALVPIMMSAEDRRRARTRRSLMVAMVGLVAILGSALAVWRLQL